uniref:Reverse transcriptase zinc-binding domain-containing protein n=1 Tax=Cannabis sativa TaxID=3483 RepID=A0A803QQD5_CANSA
MTIRTLCLSQDETIYHALVDCTFARATWCRTMVDAVISNADIGTSSTSFCNWLLMLQNKNKDGELEVVAMFIEAFTIGKPGRVQPEIAEIIGIKEALS